MPGGNIYATEGEATEPCLQFGWLIVDGKMLPRKKR